MDELSMRHTPRVQHAVILAAGNGDRFRNGTSHSKLLTLVGGVPLLTRTLLSAFNAGLTHAHVVLGYDADSVRAVAERTAPSGLLLYFHLNHDWHHENGVSVLAARHALDHQSFALMMGDHVFDSGVLHRLTRVPSEPAQTLLGIDRQPCDPETAAEATKVRLDGDRIQAIGKAINPYDALDTGLFVCDPTIFDALEASCAEGDSTLSGGVRRLADRGLVRGVDIGPARWCDIDTTADLAAAEHLVGSPSDL
jgi:choline kinase